MEINRTLFGVLAALLLAAFVWPAKGMAADSDFYAGKTITVYVGRPPGSGADLAVRSQFDHLSVTGRNTCRANRR
jgi:tripartite-type tricarboxylate transporter receptor subunit TctC